MMTKEQRAYLIQRMTSEVRDLVSANYRKLEDSETDNKKIKSALEKAGFIVTATYCLSDYIQLPVDAKIKAARDAHTKYEDSLSAELQTAVDSVHLSDNPDAVAVLASFKASIAKLKA